METDFTKMYEKGNMVYLVRYFESTEIKEVIRLKLRTIEQGWMVGIYKGSAYFIGRDMAKLLFWLVVDAEKYLKSITKKPYKQKPNDIPSQLQDEDEEETDDIYSYIDGDEEESEDED